MSDANDRAKNLGHRQFSAGRPLGPSSPGPTAPNLLNLLKSASTNARYRPQASFAEARPPSQNPASVAGDCGLSDPAVPGSLGIPVLALAQLRIKTSWSWARAIATRMKSG